jgi:2-oxoglutarate dehydrogenase E2 component (dihydrolipoamide succinyltransferase)
MIIEIRIPNVGESVTNVELSQWLVEDGTYVEKDQEIAEIDSDKATLTLHAEESGRLKIIASRGTKLNIGDLTCNIDTSAAPSLKTTFKMQVGTPQVKIEEKTQEVPTEKKEEPETVRTENKIQVTPLAKEIISEHQLDLDEIIKDKLRRITKNDVLEYIERKQAKPIVISREISKKELSPLRKKLAERLVQAKNEMAILTTWNEVDMSKIIKIRKDLGDKFLHRYGIKLGFVSLFAKAISIALMEFPEVNASIDGDSIAYHAYVDLGIAVSTEKGLMVPVIRNTESLSISEIEIKINELAEKARNKRLTIEEMQGGTFTITNGGVFGSLFSSPIVNPPQVAILGMHKIQERPVGIEGRIELRPMMYVALSYDHRIIDGKESVTFLVRVKELLESPEKMTTECKKALERLVGV